MTTRTMRLASGFLDSLSPSETVARRSRTDRGDRVCASTVEDRLGIPRIYAHSVHVRVRTTCAELAQILYTLCDSETKCASSQCVLCDSVLYKYQD